MRTTTYTCSEFSTKVDELQSLMADLSRYCDTDCASNIKNLFRLDELVALAAVMADAEVFHNIS